jgi:hypothetical protein
LHNQRWLQRHVQLVLQIRHALFFRLAAAIGEEDEGDPFFLEESQGGGCAGEGGGGADEDTVDAGERDRVS